MKNHVKIEESIKPFKKEIIVSSDKSLSIRCILLSSIAAGTSKIFNLLESDDVLNALKAIKNDSDLLTKLGNSKGEVRRMIKNNGLKINNETISDENKIFYEDSFGQNNSMKVSHGKKQHVILKII